MLNSNNLSAQGFAIIEAVFDATEVAELARTLETSDLDRSRAGARHLMNHPAVSAVAADPRMVAIAGRFLGETVIPYKATLFDKSPARNWLVAWHQDTALPVERLEPRDGWGAGSIKAGIRFAQAPAPVLSQILAIRIHLDASTPTNGPLRVVPGSHRFGILESENIDRIVRTSKSVDCTVGRGGVLGMSPLLLHASSKAISNEPRRVLHIEYAATRNVDNGITLAIA